LIQRADQYALNGIEAAIVSVAKLAFDIKIAIQRGLVKEMVALTVCHNASKSHDHDV
jgi:hypothetical protein